MCCVCAQGNRALSWRLFRGREAQSPSAQGGSTNVIVAVRMVRKHATHRIKARLG